MEPLCKNLPRYVCIIHHTKAFSIGIARKNLLCGFAAGVLETDFGEIYIVRFQTFE
jgi:hypothetical protein